MSEHAVVHYHEAVDTSHAILPANYEKAKAAIAACHRSWAKHRLFYLFTPGPTVRCSQRLGGLLNYYSRAA
jgi:hypothetical protein